MAAYSVAEAKNQLPRLIKLAMQGEEVVITRHGKPVAEIRSRESHAGPPLGDRKAALEWLKAQRDARKPVNIDSVKLLNDMYDETDV
jgi:prevent-host-death family protein